MKATILSRMLSTLAAAAQTADRIDYWIRRHVIEYSDETHPSQLKLDPGRDRRIGLPAIGQCREDGYGALATPIAPHLAALVKQLETQKTGIGACGRSHHRRIK